MAWQLYTSQCLATRVIIMCIKSVSFGLLFLFIPRLPSTLPQPAINITPEIHNTFGLFLTHQHNPSTTLNMSGKKSSDREWDTLDSLVFFARGQPHEKARSYVEDKAWDKKPGKDGKKSDSKSHWRTDSTHGSSSSKDTDKKDDSTTK
jgi:hypothetical protein